MCRSIKVLFNFDPPATKKETQEASLQFVRKLSGFRKPSKANEEAFDRAVDNITKDVQVLLKTLVTDAVPRNREQEIKKAKGRSIKRFGMQLTRDV